MRLPIKRNEYLGLIEAANKLGLSAKGVRAKFEALYIVPKPVIAHVIVHEQLQHFVVIYKVEKKKEYIEYMDPGDGRMHRVTNQEFEKCGPVYWCYWNRKKLSRPET